jgi:hypothetical protein
MSVNNFIPDDGSLWSIRAVDISGNYNQKLNLDASGNVIVRTGNTDRLTINSSGAWTCQGGMTYNNTSNTLTAATFSGALSGNATSATNIAGGAGGQIPYQSAASTTALLANGAAGQVLTSAGTTLAPTWTSPATFNGAIVKTLMTTTAVGNPGVAVLTYTVPANTMGTANGYSGRIYYNVTGGNPNMNFSITFGTTTVTSNTVSWNTTVGTYVLDFYIRNNASTSAQVCGGISIVNSSNVNNTTTTSGDILQNASVLMKSFSAFGTMAEATTSDKTLTIKLTNTASNTNAQFGYLMYQGNI